MDADGGHPRLLVHQDGIDEYPVWSPDGSRLAFNCSLGEVHSDLYVMNADGSGVTRLTHAGGEEQEPAFAPCKGACP